MAKKLDNLTIENAKIRFRNFAGAQGQYNREGDRNFAVFLDEDLAQALLDDGWNVKHLKPREGVEDAEPQAYLSVKVKFTPNSRPPKVVMVTSRGRTQLGEAELGNLDFAEIKTADVIIRPYNYEVNGRTGVTAYLSTLYATLMEDELDLKYADVPDSAQSAMASRGTPVFEDED